jgi:hypothetical protein
MSYYTPLLRAEIYAVADVLAHFQGHCDNIPTICFFIEIWSLSGYGLKYNNEKQLHVTEILILL